MQGKSTRAGLITARVAASRYRTMGTIYEKSKIPLHKWLLADAHHVRQQEGRQRSPALAHAGLWLLQDLAWFMAHRVREAMRTGDLAPPTKLGGSGGPVEVDETFSVCRQPGPQEGHPLAHRKVLCACGSRNRRKPLVVIDELRSIESSRSCKPTSRKRRGVMTDVRAPLQGILHRAFRTTKSQFHTRGEYVRGDVTTNTVEGFYSIFKRACAAFTSIAASNTAPLRR